MTSATSAQSRLDCGRRRRRRAGSTTPPTGSRCGFTLIELLVTIGIIVLIAGLLIPAIMHARRAARVTRMGADLTTIATALEAYKADFSDYPRLPPGIASTGLLTGPSPQVWGSQLLCWALLSPGTAAQDGADGPGFRIRQGSAIHQPYLPAEKFKLQINDPNNLNLSEILDINGRVILYYPARVPKPDITAANGFVADTGQPLYTAAHNDESPAKRQLTLAQLQKLLGDTDANGKIDPGETALTSNSYILWSGAINPDPSGNYYNSPDAVTNIGK